MAIATVTCNCKYCGKEFTHRSRPCHSRRDADEYAEWAKENIDMCPDCYRAKEAAKRAEKVNELEQRYAIPAITGVSEKQTAYANKLRGEYLLDHMDAFSVAREFADLPAEEVESAAKASNMTPEQALAESLEAYEATTAYKLLTMVKASEIIELLK